MLSTLPSSIGAEEQNIPIPDNWEIEDELFEEAEIDVIREEGTTSVEVVVDTTDEEFAKIVTEIEQGTDDITVYSTEYDKDKVASEKEYSVKILEANEEFISAVFIDKYTGKKYQYHSNNIEGSASIAPAIPIGIYISGAVLSHLFSIGAAIVLSGATLVLFNKAKRSKKFNHFKATIHNGKLYVGSGMGYNAAVKWSKKGKNHDTWSTSKDNAKKVAKGVGNGKKPVGPEIDKKNGKPKKGYFYHYHPYNRKPNVHAFYGLPY